MNKVFIQLWEQSEIGIVPIPDGCSIHIDLLNRDEYIKSIYSDRSDVVPDVYDRVVGDPTEVFINDEIYDILINSNSVRLQEYEMNNLMSMCELIIKK